MPLNGFTRMFENMLDHPNIDIELGVDFADIRGERVYDHVIYSGPIDEFFDYRFGKLPYRSLRFQHETKACERFQPVAVVNYPTKCPVHPDYRVQISHRSSGAEHKHHI